MGDGDDNRENGDAEFLPSEEILEMYNGSRLKHVEVQLIKRRQLLIVRKELSLHKVASDIKWSLFVAACNSHDYGTLVRPFPPQFIKPSRFKDIDGLLRTIEFTPPFHLILMRKNDHFIYPIKNSVVNLLYWLLIENDLPCLRKVEQEHVDTVLSRVTCEAAIPKPNHVFQLIYSMNDEEEKNWKSMYDTSKNVYACYGAKPEKFYSIVQCGVKSHALKTVQSSKGGTCCRNGLYLSSDLCDGISRSPSGYCWGGSTCGSQLCCVALCELAEHERYISCTRLGAEDENEIRQIKHYNVTNPDKVRVRFLLVYNENKVNEEKYDGAPAKKGFFNWIRSHKLLSLLLGYGALLVVTWVMDMYFV